MYVDVPGRRRTCTGYSYVQQSILFKGKENNSSVNHTSNSFSVNFFGIAAKTVIPPGRN